MSIYSEDKLLNLNKERIHKNKDYKWVRLYIQDKQIFGVEHSSNVRLAGKYYRSGIKSGEMSQGDREYVFYFLLAHDAPLSHLNQMISKLHNEIMVNTGISISANIVACVVMELYMDDVLETQKLVSKYIKIANKTQPNHIWRFATLDEYEDYRIDMMEEHHNGIPVAAYQVKRDVRYYEWMADPLKTANREWVKEKYDKNLFCVVNYMINFGVPMYFLVGADHGIEADKAIICGKLETDGSYEVGVKIPRDVFKASRAALM